MFRTKLHKLCYSSSIEFPTETTSHYLHHRINTFLSNKTSDLKTLHQFHAFIITTGHTNNVYIAAKLISLYASNKHYLISSKKVFDLISFKDPFLWNSIIKAYFSNGYYSEALELYSNMRGFNALPNQFTIPIVVSACAELGLVYYGKKIHGLVSKLNLFHGNNAAVGSSLVYMYSKCGFMEYAADVFDEITVRDVVSWTAIVKGYVENGESEKGLEYLCLIHKNGESEVRPNFRTLEGGFQACGNLGALVEGKCLHGLTVKSGFGSHQVVQCSLLSMYSKCGSVEETYRSFCDVDEKDLFSWTSIIAAYAKFECIVECVDMFLKMQASGITPDGMVISCVLSGLGNAMKIFEAKAFHGFILRRNYDDHMVCNVLLAMYCKLRLFNLAEKIFDGGIGQTTEAWNMMVVGYFKAGLEGKCMNLFREMQHLGIECDVNSLISVISSCSRLEEFHLGLSLHCHVIKNLMLENVSVANSLIDVYGRSKNRTLSWRLFCVMANKDVVTWNTMMTSYISCGKTTEAFGLFDKMIAESYKPTIATLLILLSACSQVSSLEKGEEVHEYIKEVGFEKNTLLATALTDMYAKCGQLTKSREIFDSVDKKDVVSWNVLISGYAMYGEATSAIEIFKQMEQSENKPNELTFLAVLSACAHAGLVEEGKSIFSRMKDYSLMPTLKHYACMADLLGRSGNLDDAEALVLSMPIAPDSAIWGSLLSSCKIHGQVEKGIRIAKHAIESDPENDGYYVAISDLYSSVGMWKEVEMVRKIMKERKVRKEVGWSTV